MTDSTQLSSIIFNLFTNKVLSLPEFCTLIDSRDTEIINYNGIKTTVREMLKTQAVKIAQSVYGKKIFVRGLIEFTNYCKNNCYYCGIRAGNEQVKRFRLSKEEILQCADEGYKNGFRTIVLQGGEDYYFSDDDMSDIICSLKKKYNDIAVTLSVGEREKETYKKWKEAGADRYLLRHETASDFHYSKLHPNNLSPEHRKQCLWNLKELGFQTGAGFMIDSPYQTTQNIAQDLLFLKQLNPQMIGIGPFIHHNQTPFAQMADGTFEKTVFLLSVLRIMFPSVLLPSTTALGTIQQGGREQGILYGANVIMPNLSPATNKKNYELYNNKLYSEKSTFDYMNELKKNISAIGYEIVTDRGDFIKQ